MAKITDNFGVEHNIDFGNIGQTFLCVDCMDVMREMPDKCIDLSIVDPPYGIGEDGSKAITRGKQEDFGKTSKSNAKAYAREYKPFTGGDKSAPGKEYFEELIRVSRNQIIWGANHFISRVPFDSSCWVVWDKRNDANDFADCELAWTSFKTAVRVFRFKWNGMLQENMANKEYRIHPTQKPVALYRWILQNYAKHGDKIFDSHVGSASSLVACYEMGFDFIGCEIDKDYYSMAKLRIDKTIAQQRLFDLSGNIVEQQCLFTDENVVVPNA